MRSVPTLHSSFSRFRRAGVFAAVAALSVAAVSLSSCAAKPSEPLRFGIMPDADSLPFMVAADEGLFAKRKVAVELVTFVNAQERDAAIQAGKVDGAISDILAAAFLKAGGFDAKVTSASDGRYGIAAAPGSAASGASDLAGKSVGLSTNTIIQYSVEAILGKAGVAPEAYKPVAIPKMPVRMEALLAGQVDAAGLPEPLLSAAVARGAKLVETTDAVGIDAGVILFMTAALDTRLSDVKKLYAAYEDATARIKADPAKYKAFLVEKANFPADAVERYRLVDYRKPALPPREQVEKAIAWLNGKGLLKAEVDPASLVNGRIAGAW